MKIYNGFGRFVKNLYRFLHPRWQAKFLAAAQQPAVYLVHHRNMQGPVSTLAFLPNEAHIWALDSFTDRRACFAQFYGYTFTKRFGWPKWLAFPLCALLSLIVPAFIGSFRAIPVYRGHSDIQKTMQLSLTALLRGESIVICPDIDYAAPSPEMGEVYMGFLKLEAMYYEACGRHLPFLPTYCSDVQKTLCVGEAVTFHDEEPFRAGRKRVAAKLRADINEIGRQCGDIPAPAPLAHGLATPAQSAPEEEPPGQGASPAAS